MFSIPWLCFLYPYAVILLFISIIPFLLSFDGSSNCIFSIWNSVLDEIPEGQFQEFTGWTASDLSNLLNLGLWPSLITGTGKTLSLFQLLLSDWQAMLTSKYLLTILRSFFSKVFLLLSPILTPKV